MKNIWDKNDLITITELMKRNAPSTQAYMCRKLTKYYHSALVIKKNYILAFGNIPVVMVAHMDTVEEIKSNYELIYDKDKNIATSLFSFGFDDKLGLFTILTLLEKGYKPNLILTMGEEVGGIGASALVKDYPTCPFVKVKYLMELDRMGLLNYVTYSNGDKKIDEYITSISKYIKDIGSYSDVETIGPAWKIGFANFSIGYYCEHTQNEYVNVSEWFSCLEQIENLLDDIHNAPSFEYVEDPMMGWGDYADIKFDPPGTLICDNCYRTDGATSYNEVYDELGNSVLLCDECLHWLAAECSICKHKYIPKIDQQDNICAKCKSKYKKAICYEDYD